MATNRGCGGSGCSGGDGHSVNGGIGGGDRGSGHTGSNDGSCVDFSDRSPSGEICPSLVQKV